MLDRPMSEIAILTEQFAMVRSYRDVRIGGKGIEKLLHNAIQIFHRVDLPSPQLAGLELMKDPAPSLTKFATDHVVVRMFKNAMYAADTRPLIGRFVRQRVRVIRFACIQEIERCRRGN